MLRSKKKFFLVSGNASGEKNLHPRGRKFVFFIDFPFLIYYLFFLRLFCFFNYCFFNCLFEVFGNYGGWMVKQFSSDWFQGFVFIGLMNEVGESPPPKLFYIYPTMGKLYINILYLKKIENCINHVTHLDTWHILISLDITNFSTDLRISRNEEVQV